MLDKNNEVLFGEYCKTCKYERYSETDSPCAECLAEPVNLYSRKPVKWEGADGIYAGPPPRPDHAYQRAVNDAITALKNELENGFLTKELFISSSTEDSTKKFKITVDDSGTISATEVTA